MHLNSLSSRISQSIFNASNIPGRDHEISFLFYSLEGTIWNLPESPQTGIWASQLTPRKQRNQLVAESFMQTVLVFQLMLWKFLQFQQMSVWHWHLLRKSIWYRSQCNLEVNHRLKNMCKSMHACRYRASICSNQNHPAACLSRSHEIRPRHTQCRHVSRSHPKQSAWWNAGIQLLAIPQYLASMLAPHSYEQAPAHRHPGARLPCLRNELHLKSYQGTHILLSFSLFVSCLGIRV